MKILVGLGNPGVAYARSRHNAGFALVDYVAAQFNLQLQLKSKFPAELLRTQVPSRGQVEDLCLFKPLAFMNRSGEALRKFLDYYYPEFMTEDEGNHLLVAHDDLDLPLGEFKLHKGKGPKQHNGLQSIYQQLGHKNFWHLRLGVDSRAGDRRVPPSDYVLLPMSAAEEQQLQQAIAAVFKLLFV